MDVRTYLKRFRVLVKYNIILIFSCRLVLFRSGAVDAKAILLLDTLELHTTLTGLINVCNIFSFLKTVFNLSFL